MGTYITRRCPHCRHTLESFERKYYAIGPPLINCPSCHQGIKLDHITEWGLKNIFQKIGFILITIYTTIFYGLMGGILLYVGFSYIFEYSINNFDALILGLITWLSYSLYHVFSLGKEIAESNNRLNDSSYRKKLEEAGFRIDQ